MRKLSSPGPQAMGSRQVSRQGGVLGHAGPIPQVRGLSDPLPSARRWLCPGSPWVSWSGRAGMCLPACRQGTAPGTCRGHTGLGEDMVPPPVSRHVTTPLSSPLRLAAGPFLLPHLPPLCGLHGKVSGPTSGLCGLVTCPPCLPQPPLLRLLLLTPSSHGCRWTSLPTGMLSGPP